MPRAYHRTAEKNEKMKGKRCLGPSCTRGAVAKGFCDAHYHQMKRYGRLHAINPVNTRVDDIPGIGYENDAQ
jgi:hypothetical protein